MCGQQMLSEIPQPYLFPPWGMGVSPTEAGVAAQICVSSIGWGGSPPPWDGGNFPVHRNSLEKDLATCSVPEAATGRGVSVRALVDSFGEGFWKRNMIRLRPKK